MKKPIKILFLTPYPFDTAGSQRFRFEQYLDYLKEAGFVISQQSFIDEQTWDILYKDGFQVKKAWGIIKGFLRRVWAVFKSISVDFVFIHREASPIGPPIFEWLLAKVLRKKIIYDFDDAIWKENTSGQNVIASKLKWVSKVSDICRWSYKISCGNEYLANYARQFNEQVIINPTTIDTENRHLPNSVNNMTPIIGWTGTHSTLKYLEIIVEPLMKLSQEFDFQFLVIADKQPEIDIHNFIYKSWNKSSEIDDLNLIDIGVMPLTDDEWSQGKCGFKALQFMALEKPVLVFPIGVNEQIVVDGVSGFHCSAEEGWYRYLKQLLENPSIGQKMGREGRIVVKEKYSVESNRENFMRLFQ